MNKLAVGIALCVLVAAAQSAEVVVALKNITFSKTAVTITAGDTVRFVNEDPVRHNVYSADEPGSFDLGAYPKGESRSVQFRDLGVHEVRCSIHSNMKLQVTVAKPQP